MKRLLLTLAAWVVLSVPAYAQVWDQVGGSMQVRSGPTTPLVIIDQTNTSADNKILSLRANGTEKCSADVEGDFTCTGTYTLGSCIAFTAGTNLCEDAANVLAQRNGTSAQTLRSYNTFTDASNYERGVFGWAVNALEIGTEAAGTGNGRALNLRTNSIQRWQVGGTSGHLLAFIDNTYDIGASGATRPRSIYAAGTIFSDAGFVVPSRFQLAMAGADGLALFTNAAGTGFTRLILGTNDTTTGGSSWVKDSGGHLLFRRGDGSTGTLSVANVTANSCGTTAATITGTDAFFAVTVGATSGTRCRVTFVAAWETAPYCFVNNSTTANLARADTSTTTTIDLAGTFVGGDVLWVHCGR